MGISALEKIDYWQHIDRLDELALQDAAWNDAPNLQAIHDIAYHLKQCAGLIDMGAGTGVAIPYWLDRADRVIAVDQSSACCDKLRERFPVGGKVTVVQSDVRTYQGVAEVVVAKAFLKHFGPDEWAAILTRLLGMATRQAIFTMGINEDDELYDRNPDVPYYDLGVPLHAIDEVLHNAGWRVTKTLWPDALERGFVCVRS